MPNRIPAEATAALRLWALTRARRAWAWPLLAFALTALLAAFLVWTAFHFNHLYGYWRAVSEMEVGALRVPAGQSLSIMVPIWIGLGLLAYSLALAAILHLWWLERRWQALVGRALSDSE